MSITSIALDLAKFVPDIIDWIAGDKEEKVAKDLVTIAENITRQKSEKAVEALEQNQILALAFQREVMKYRYRFDALVMADRKDARDTYKIHHDASDRIAFMIMKFNLPLVFLLVLLDVVACIFLANNAALLTVVSTSTGFVIQSLLKERQDVTGFHFGSSIGSKMKTMAGVK